MQSKVDDTQVARDEVRYLPETQTVVPLIAVLRILLANKLWVAIFTLVFAGLAALWAFTATPIYRATILVAPVTDDRSGLAAFSDQLGGLASLAGLSVSGGNDVNQMMAILDSRQFTTAFISELDLLPVLFAQYWDQKRDAWRVPPEEIPTMSDAYRRFDQHIRTIRQDDETHLVQLTMDWKDPAVAASWANDMIAKVNERIRARAINQARQSIDFLNAEAEKTNVVELRQAIYRLIESQINEIMLANVRQDYAFEIIDPAVASDPEDFIWPKRPLIILLGAVFGFILATLFVLNKDLFKLHRT